MHILLCFTNIKQRRFAFATVEHLKFIRRDTEEVRWSARALYHYPDNHHYQQYCYSYCHLLAEFHMPHLCLFFCFCLYLPTCISATRIQVNCNRMSNKKVLTHSMTFWCRARSRIIEKKGMFFFRASNRLLFGHESSHFLLTTVTHLRDTHCRFSHCNETFAIRNLMRRT